MANSVWQLLVSDYVEKSCVCVVELETEKMTIQKGLGENQSCGTGPLLLCRHIMLGPRSFAPQGNKYHLRDNHSGIRLEPARSLPLSSSTLTIAAFKNSESWTLHTLPTTLSSSGRSIPQYTWKPLPHLLQGLLAITKQCPRPAKSFFTFSQFFRLDLELLEQRIFQSCLPPQYLA